MRDCNNCIWHDGQCVAWECNYINRDEAANLYRAEVVKVHCKDCRSYEPDDSFCKFWNDYMGEQGYCSCGEKRKEDKPESLLEAMAKFRSEEKEQSKEAIDLWIEVLEERRRREEQTDTQ